MGAADDVPAARSTTCRRFGVVFMIVAFLAAVAGVAEILLIATPVGVVANWVMFLGTFFLGLLAYTGKRWAMIIGFLFAIYSSVQALAVATILLRS
jgi:hypothetical protein